MGVYTIHKIYNLWTSVYAIGRGLCIQYTYIKYKISLTCLCYVLLYVYNINDNYLQLLYREVKGILLYQGFPRPMLPTKHPEPSVGCFVGKVGRGNQWLKFFLPKTSFTQFHRLLR